MADLEKSSLLPLSAMPTGTVQRSCTMGALFLRYKCANGNVEWEWQECGAVSAGAGAVKELGLV